jgi:hypothetical protein
MDKIEEDYEGRIMKKDIIRKYSDYCKRYGLTPKSDFVKKKILQEDYGANDGQNYEGERFWDGIKWRLQIKE